MTSRHDIARFCRVEVRQAAGATEPGKQIARAEAPVLDGHLLRPDAPAFRPNRSRSVSDGPMTDAQLAAARGG
jgi:hypothetical protein